MLADKINRSGTGFRSDQRPGLFSAFAAASAAGAAYAVYGAVETPSD